MLGNNKHTAIVIGLVVITNFSIADNLFKYTPSATPIVKIATPKPNIYILLDDSNSMYIANNNHAYMSVKEHFFGPGNPVCEIPTGAAKNKWDQLVKQYANMEGKFYNPLQTGRYKPYLREVIGDTEYEKYDASIPIERCSSKVYRTEAVIQMVPELLEKYSKRAYLGYGGLGKYQLNGFRGASNINIANTTGIRDGVCKNSSCTAYYVELFLAKLRQVEGKTRGGGFKNARGVANKSVKDDARYNVFEQTITDMSNYTPDNWKQVKASIAHNIMGEYSSSPTQKNYLLGGTPTFNALYNVNLYFRGYPIVEKGFKAPAYVFGGGYSSPYYLNEITEDFSSLARSAKINPNNPNASTAPSFAIDANASGIVKLYGTKTIAPPKRYRCTTNSVIVLTDGDANDNELGIVARKDLAGNGGVLPTRTNGVSGWELQLNKDGGGDLNNLSEKDKVTYERALEGTLHFQTNTGYKMSSASSSDYLPGLMKLLNKTIAREFTKDSMREGTYVEKDEAEKSWGSDKFSIPQKLQVNAVQYGQDKFNQYLGDLTKETAGQVITLPEDASSTAILAAMEKIMGDLIRSTSNAQVVTSQFQQTVNSVRYVFKYNIESKHGEIIANKADKTTASGWANAVLWNSATSFSPSSGKFITMDYKNQAKPALITMDSISTAYKRGTNGVSHLHSNHIGWLRGEEVFDDINLPSEKRVYRKTSSIGPIVNSEGALFAHDVEYINLNSMGGVVKEEFNQYVLYKNKQLKRDYMVVNANDGMVHFLSIPRSSPNIEKELAEGVKSVEHVAAYFPGILAYRLPQLSNINTFSYSMDGIVRLFEFKDSQGDIRSIGLSGFGAGGRGIVGYQLFKATPGSEGGAFKNPDSEIKPLFEISNESNWRKYGDNAYFENLGHTFSDFGFFNQIHPKNFKAGRGVAVFGNGYGENQNGKSPSSLYFIDVETGEFIKEIVLNEHGGGASSPALVVEKLGDYQTLKRIYVGDISGKLYRITFTADDLTHTAVEVLYEPVASQYNPISTRPLIVEDQGDEWVYFGTGRKSDGVLDRGITSPSKDVQYIVGLKNPNPIEEEALTINALHQNKIIPSNKITIGAGSTSEKEIQTLTTQYIDSDTEKIEKGWYLALSSGINAPAAKTAGERVVFSPKQSYGDVIFSTWGLDEYDVSGDDPCVEDYVYGKVLILDKKTGLPGTGSMANKKIGGFVVANNAPGISSGYGVFVGRSSGESYGKSTLDKKTVEELNKAAASTYALADTKSCIGNVADDAANVYDFTVMCPPKRVIEPIRLSIRTIH